MSVSVFSRRGWFAAALSLVLSACAAGAPPKAADGEALEPLQVQTASGAKKFWVEIADDDAERTEGLMFRERLAGDHGMLFDFGQPQPAAFWMKNTLVPLDIIFIGADGRIRNVGANAKPLDESPVPSAGPVRYVLELNAGKAAELGIKPGDKVVHRLIPGG